MKSGEDFRQAMGQADDGFVKMVAQALSELRMPRKKPAPRRRTSVAAGHRHRMRPAAITRDA